jgi:hypothetical protein
MDFDFLKKQQKTAQQDAASELENDLKTVASTVEGRRLLKRLLRQCNAFQTTFTGDAMTGAFQEGKRYPGLWLLSVFESCPELYLQLLTEKTHD